MGRQDGVDLLQRNLQNVQQTLQFVRRLQEQVGAVTPKTTA